jgi:hypothetical protein
VPEPEILYVQSRRVIRAKRVQTVQHVFAAVILFSAGYQHLHHNPLFATCEILAAVLLIGAVVVEKLRHGHARSGGIAWVEFAGAVMMFVEAIDKLQQPHRFLFYVLSFVPPTMLLAFAIFDSQIARRHYIRVDDDGVECRTSIFWRRRVPWSAIRGYRRDGTAIRFGERKISLRDVIDREAAATWLMDALARRGIQILSGSEGSGRAEGTSA